MTTARRGARRRRFWVDHNVTNRDLPVNTQVNFDILDPMSDATTGHTIVRILLTLMLSPAIDEAVNQASICHWGLVMAHQDTVTAVGLPDPGGVPDAAGWLLRDAAIVSSLTVGVDPRQQMRFTYDLSSQRVLRTEQMSCHFVIDTIGVGGLMDVRLDAMFRTLLLQA